MVCFLAACFVLCCYGLVLAESVPNGGTISYDARSFLFDGKRELLLSGGMHYPRVPAQDWDRVMKLAKNMNLNTIQTYIFWNFHEKQKGVFDFTGQADIVQFVKLAQANDLYLTVRIGPYICGEYYYGGIPLWMRDIDNITCFRCDDPIWEREMQAFVSLIVKKLEPYLYTNGGPIIMLQIENEYSGSQTYLDWSVDMARNLTTEVPWNLCHDVHQCTAVNSNGEKAVCTINGFWMEQRDAFVSQPSVAWINAQKQGNPTQPLMWTEDQGWFDQWGVAQRIRDSRDQAFGILRWIAHGGSYHNFYMMTGGNNYGRLAGGAVVTAYAPDTVIDYLLLRHMPRYQYYAEMFGVLMDYKQELLSHPIATAVPLASSSTGSGTTTLGACDSQNAVWTFDTQGDYGLIKANGVSGQCLVNGGKDAATASCNESDANQLWVYESSSGHIMNKVESSCKAKSTHGVCSQCADVSSGQGPTIDMWDCKQPSSPQLGNQKWTLHKNNTLFNPETKQCLVAQAGPGIAEYHAYGKLIFLSNFDSKASTEVTFQGRQFFLSNHSVVVYDASLDEVLFNTSALEPHLATGRMAHKQSAQIKSKSWQVFYETAGNATIQVKSQSPLEQLNITDNDSDYMFYTTSVPFSVQAHDVSVNALTGSVTSVYTKTTSSGTEISVLSSALGMPNTGVKPSVHKGISGASAGGKDITNHGWTMSWMLYGEAKQIYTSAGASTVEWSSLESDMLPADTSLVWMKGFFDLPAAANQPNQTAYALDLSPLFKGTAYVNGFNIGRYWLRPGVCDGDCAPPHHGDYCYMRYRNCGKPTQSIYHIPYEVLKPTDNLVVLFEDSVSTAPRNLSQVALVVLHEHPPA